MPLPNDPIILFSYINTMLRDNYSDLDELCKSLCIPKEQITEKLASVGFAYDPNSNSFK
ncbi:MAG: DUF4250 domain-containing protein [Ruminococcus sp.]|nr:DUF4250 domain-containing protein [Ruminococcus sp.]